MAWNGMEMECNGMKWNGMAWKWNEYRMEMGWK